MPISNKNKLIFIHIPKTAGSSIFTRMFNSDKNTILTYCNIKNKYLYVGNYDYHRAHYTFKEIQKICDYINLNISNYQIFTVVRNPYYRFLSILQYAAIHNEHNNVFNYINIILDKLIYKDYNIIHKKYCMCGGMNFYQFNIDKTNFFIECKHLIPQTFFLINNNNTIDIKIKIIKFEELDTGFKTNNLTLFNNLEKTNSGKEINYEDYLTETIKDKIYKLYDIDFINFNYEK
jgi:hypothetical protein